MVEEIWKAAEENMRGRGWRRIRWFTRFLATLAFDRVLGDLHLGVFGKVI